MPQSYPTSDHDWQTVAATPAVRDALVRVTLIDDTATVVADYPVHLWLTQTYDGPALSVGATRTVAAYIADGGLHLCTSQPFRGWIEDRELYDPITTTPMYDEIVRDRTADEIEEYERAKRGHHV